MAVPITNPKFSDICLEIYGSSSTNGRTLLTAFGGIVSNAVFRVFNNWDFHILF